MDKFVVYGNPIAHSWSPVIHREFARQEGLVIEYERCLVESDFAETVHIFFAGGGKGANVTMPFKEEAMRASEVVSKRAQLAGAVNTLYMEDGKLHGDNTDGKGFVMDLQRQFGSCKDTRVLLIGAGGAVRGVVAPLLESGVADIQIVNRTASKAIGLAGEFSSLGNVSGGGLDALPTKQFDIIVNCTSSSVNGDVPNIKDSVFERALFAYDMYYQEDATAFMQFARNCNSQINVSDGLGMLIGQAAESFRIWTSIAPDVDATMEFMKKQLFG